MNRAFELANNKDPCPCGSGKKFKRCCTLVRLHFALSQQTRDLSQASLFDRNNQLLDALNELFDLEQIADINQLKHRVTKNTVRQLYERISTIFPFGLDLEYLLPEPGHNLRALFLGTAHPRSVLNNISRYSLYSDEILIYSPFVNPWTMAPEFNPLLKPEVYQQETLSSLVLVALLGPWIRKGLVHLIPDPGDFDLDLKFKSAASAEKRIKNRALTLDEPYKEEFEATFTRFIGAAPDEFLFAKFKEFNPAANEFELNQMVLAMRAMNNKDPLALAGTTVEQIHWQRGGNLEIAAFVAQATNAFPYTDLKFRWQEIKDCIQDFPADSQPWSPLTESFQQLSFKFLDNVDPNFAFQLHEDGRLQSLRSFLRKVWRNVESPSKSTVRDFCDELSSEYSKAKDQR